MTRILRFGEAAMIALAGLAWAAGAGPLLAASPSPPSGDVRTTAAPGVVGDPLFAIAGVLVIGLVALLVTLAYVRLSGPPGIR